MQSADVVLRVLRVLVEAPGPMLLRDLAAAAGMPAAKAHRYLVSLARAGFAEQPRPGRPYHLGPRALELGLVSLARLDYLRVAGDALPQLCRRADETVALALWSSRGPIFVRWEEPPHPVATNVRLGSLVPVLRSASGRVLAAYLPAEVTAPFIEAELRLDVQARRAGEPRTRAVGEPRTRAAVEQLLAEVRNSGLARVSGDLRSGVNAISAPVFDHNGRIVLALTVLGDASRFDCFRNDPIARAVRETALEVSRRLGYRA
ncbi:MAG: IclR family transcriptional regulator [Burkholderiales bacterium]|nr:IclR family transcriptional regulator [Burkholderiales bacterium]